MYDLRHIQQCMTNTDKLHELVQVNWESKSLEGTQGVQFNALGNRINNIYTTVFRVKQSNAKREIV